MMSTQHRLSRRAFLYRSTLCWSSIALGPLACGQRDSCSTFEIDAKVPMRLLFPSRTTSVEPMRLTHLTCVGVISDVLLRFSDGRKLGWDKGLSFRKRVAQRGGTADRAAVAVKVTAAYTLERLAQILRRARTGDIISRRSEGKIDDDEYRAEIAALLRLEHDFEVFQEQRVLDVVTIGAVYDFARALDGSMHRLALIVWSEEDRQFVVRPA